MTDRRRKAAKVAVTALVAALAWLFVWPATLGGSMTYVSVSGPSMEPTYVTGDFVAARAQQSYDVGDVVVFGTEKGNVIHRIVDGDADAGFVMQGDNNPEADVWTPTSDDVLGKAVLHLPRVGDGVIGLRHVLTTPPFTYLLAGFVVLVIVLGDPSKKAGQTTHQDQSTRGSLPEPKSS